MLVLRILIWKPPSPLVRQAGHGGLTVAALLAAAACDSAPPASGSCRLRRTATSPRSTRRRRSTGPTLAQDQRLQAGGRRLPPGRGRQDPGDRPAGHRVLGRLRGQCLRRHLGAHARADPGGRQDDPGDRGVAARASTGRRAISSRRGSASSWSSMRPFYIIGEVTRPGQFPYVNCLRVIQAIAIGGGFTRRAGKTRLTIKRFYSTTRGRRIRNRGHPGGTRRCDPGWREVVLGVTAELGRGAVGAPDLWRRTIRRGTPAGPWVCGSGRQSRSRDGKLWVLSLRSLTWTMRPVSAGSRSRQPIPSVLRANRMRWRPRTSCGSGCACSTGARR